VYDISVFGFPIVKSISKSLTMSLSQSEARSQPDLLESQEAHVKRVMGGFSTVVRDNTASGNSVLFAGPVADTVNNNYAVKYVTPHL
jgi:hypothetical protein